MLYNCIKIIHIFSAALLITSIAYSIYLWRFIFGIPGTTDRIQANTWGLIVPFALFQLTTGFTMISLQHYDLSHLWIKSSVLGFVVVIISWFAFIYFLLSEKSHTPHFYRKLQATMLAICMIALLSMIFFMANKVT